MLLGMALILQVTASPPTLSLTNTCMFMTPVWPLKAFEFEIPVYFMGYPSSLYHSNVTIPWNCLSGLLCRSLLCNLRFTCLVTHV